MHKDRFPAATHNSQIFRGSIRGSLFLAHTTVQPVFPVGSFPPSVFWIYLLPVLGHLSV